jgi:L-rhamnonate dehydratase
VQTHIVRIEWARLEGERPRKAGCNARLGDHGQHVATPIARVTTSDGATGFGWARLDPARAEALLGLPLTEAAASPDTFADGIAASYRAIEYPLLDLFAKRTGEPVYTLIGTHDTCPVPLRVPCYDTSLYIDELPVADEVEAVDLIAREAAEGAARGHRAFKIKVGRGAMHMDLEAGTQRDVAVIGAVRECVGADARLMIDANNGYNLNLTKRVLAESADARVYWMEEAFHEDATLYGHLKSWLAAEDLPTLIADGEGDASPRLLDWAQQGLIDVIQYDIRFPGFSRWLELGSLLDGWGARSAPHNYGEPYGNYAACHLASAIRRFEMVEWDEATINGLDGSAYALDDGLVRVPDLPGFGLDLDEAIFTRAVQANGFIVSA